MLESECNGTYSLALLGRTRASEFLSRNVGCFLTACLKALVLAVTVQGRLLDESFSIRTATGTGTVDTVT